jgi:hypothetical protein
MKLSIYAIRVSKRISGLKVSGQLVAKSVGNNKCYKVAECSNILYSKKNLQVFFVILAMLHIRISLG